jgi:hypothetical protein
LLADKFRCHQLFDSISLFVFHIATQFRFHAEQSLLAMVDDAFTVQHRQHLLTTSFHEVVVVDIIGKMLFPLATSATMLKLTNI